MSKDLSRTDNIVDPPTVLEGQSFENWPKDCKTERRWKYNFGRVIKRRAEPTYVTIDGNSIPVFHVDQTKQPNWSPLEHAKVEYLRRFWHHARHDRYLDCGGDVFTIDFEKQLERGNGKKWFGERLVLDHLMGKSIFGMFAEEYDYKQARTYWIAIDLDLHLDTGGNLDLFSEQAQILLNRIWGHKNTQVVVSEKRVNGIHIYVFFEKPLALDHARKLMRNFLADIHKDYPYLARRIDEWNARLRAAYPDKKGWRIRQIHDEANPEQNALEIYPDQKKGFRFLGMIGKVVLANKVIDRTSWGVFQKGRRKGDLKIGFDVVSWWESLQTEDRMPLADVLDYIKARLPDKSKQLSCEPVVIPNEQRIEEEHSPPPVAVVSSSQSLPTTTSKTPQPKRLGSLYRQTRKKVTGYWQGIFNPPDCFETISIITARLLYYEGLSEEEAVALIQRYAREIPENVGQQCCGRIADGKWDRIDGDIETAVKNAFDGNGRQEDVDSSDEELQKTIATWQKYGFRLSDKSTWNTTGRRNDTPTPAWTEQDKRDFELWLMPVLKIKDSKLAVAVATAVVKLTIEKEKAEDGWGLAYLKKWLPREFGIKCGNTAKQCEVFRALRELNLIAERVAPRKGRATGWTLGKRANARIAGDSSDKWKEMRVVSLPDGWKEGIERQIKRERNNKRNGSTYRLPLLAEARKRDRAWLEELHKQAVEKEKQAVEREKEEQREMGLLLGFHSESAFADWSASCT